MEIWKPVAGIDGYMVSNLGRVKSICQRKGGRSNVNEGIMTGWTQKNRSSYKRQLVSFRLNKKTITKKLHHVVLEAFVGPRPSGLMGLHKNGNPLDNRVENLRWGSQKENVQDSIEHSTKTNPPVHRGEAHPNATLTDEQVNIIRETVFVRGTQAALARKFGVADITISRIKKGLARMSV